MKLQLIAAVASVLFSVVPGAFAEHKLRPKALVDAEDYQDHYADFDPEDKDFDLLEYQCNSNCLEQFAAEGQEIDLLAYHACCGGGNGGRRRRRRRSYRYYKPRYYKPAVSCIVVDGITTCPNNMDMTIDGSGCTCTPSSARKPRYYYPPPQPYGKAFKVAPPGPPGPPGRGGGCSRPECQTPDACSSCGETCGYDSRKGCHHY